MTGLIAGKGSGRKMEIWDLYDRERRVIGEHIRGNEMPENGYHLVVHIWIRNREGKYLMTQRSENKKTCPLKWECVGGSVLQGETSLHAALREVKEEVGIDLTPESGGLVQTRIRDTVDGRRINDINDIYLYTWDGEVDLGRATTDEVRRILWMDRDGIADLYRQGEMVSVIKDLSYFIDNDKGLF